MSRYTKPDEEYVARRATKKEAEALGVGDYLPLFQIVDRGTGEVVHTIDVSKKGQRARAKIANALDQKVDWERFYAVLTVEPK